MKQILFSALPVIVLCLIMLRGTSLFGIIGLPAAGLWLANLLLICCREPEVREQNCQAEEERPEVP